MKKFLKIALKEILLVKSQKIAIALIFLYPLFAIVSIGFAFGGSDIFDTSDSGFEKIVAGIVLPNTTSLFDANQFMEKLSASPNVKFVKVASDEELKELIDAKKVQVGLKVNPPQKFNQDVNVVVFVDNSSLLSSRALASLVSVGIDNVSVQTSTEILRGIFSDLSLVHSTLLVESKKTDEFIQKLLDSSVTLNELNDNINSIDVSSLRSDLGQFGGFYGTTVADLNTVKSDFNSYREKIVIYSKSAEKQKNDLVEINKNLIFLREQTANAKNLSFEPIKSELKKLENDLTKRIDDIGGSISSLTKLSVDLNELDGKLVVGEQKVNDTIFKLNDANVVIGKFDKTFVKLESTLGEMRNLVSQADDSRVATITDLDRTKILLNQLIDKLADLKKYDPGFLVKPITAHEQKTYNVNNLTVITPVAISIVLLLTTMLLTAVSVILERTQGVSYRISLSTTDKISWFGGKILGQMFFAFLESLLIILVAVLFFGVSFNGSFYELFIALFIISACFISIGLVITTFTETQSTAILLALLIMVPLIFLSGAIFPLEFMPKTISTISGYLPLTISINLLNAIIVKGSTIALYGQQLTILIFTTIVLLAYSIWRNRV